MTSADDLLSVLTHSHEQLVSAVAPLTAEEMVGPAYPSEWSIAQTMSHLGSGAEIFSLTLKSALAGGAALERAEMAAVWDVWNAKTPQDQVADALVADAAFLDSARSVTPGQRETLRVQLFNGEQDLAGILRTRLGEQALHVWDVLVTLDPRATLPSDAAAMIVDRLAQLVTRTGKPSTNDLVVNVQTTDPVRGFGLHLGPDGPTFTEGAPTAATASLKLPADALVRLIYGRLDPDHTPSTVQADGVDLAELRTVFPGF